MPRKKSVAIISSAIVLLLIIAICIEAFVTGRSTPFDNTTSSFPEREASSIPKDIVIVLEKEAPTPMPTPTPSPTPIITPTPYVTPKVTAPTNPPMTSTPSPTNGTELQEPVYTAPEITPVPPQRPIVIEEPPAPTEKPTVTEISLNTYSIEILVEDSWRINILSAPDSVFSQGATWRSSNSSVIDLIGADLSGVTVRAKAPGNATVTIYSKDGNYQATCSVTVS